MSRGTLLKGWGIRLSAVVGLVVLGAALASWSGKTAAMFGPSTQSVIASPTPTPQSLCPSPVDISLVLDRTGSMDGTKLVQARQAAQGLVDTMAGGPGSPSVAPSTIGIVSFHSKDPTPETDGIATVDQAMTGSATTLRAVLDLFTVGYGHTNIGEAVWRGEAQLAGSPSSSADYMVLLSDGGANRPAFVPTDYVDLDVNNDGVINDLDDLSVDYDTDTDSVPDFVVVDGRLTFASPRDLCQALDVTSNQSCFSPGLEDDYDFGADADFAAAFPGVTPNFRIRDAHLQLDTNGTGGFQDFLSPKFNPLGGDNADASVYAQYHATQAKKTGTTIFVIGLTVGGADEDLLQSIASSPATYFPVGDASDLNAIFQEIAWTVCPATPTPTATNTATPTPTSTATRTPTATSTATPTKTSTPTPTRTATATPTSTFTATATSTSSPTPSSTPTATSTATPTATATNTSTPTETPKPPSPTPTATETLVPPSPTPTATETPVPPSPTPTATETLVPPSPTPTVTDTPVPPSPTPTVTETPIAPSSTPTATATAGTSTPTRTPTHTHTPEASNTPRHHDDETDTPVPQPSATFTPVSQVSPAAVTPRAAASATPRPSAEALPHAGSGGESKTAGTTSAALIAFVLSGIAVLEGRRLLRHRR